MRISKHGCVGLPRVRATIHMSVAVVQLSSSNEQIHTFISNTRVSTEGHLATSKELSLRRHSLADELSELSSELVSVLHDGDSKPTLLEDIETLHRSLKELESIKQYVQIIQHGLQLRFVLLPSSEFVLKCFYSEAAVGQVEAATTVTMSTLTTFQDLQKFVEKVTTTCADVEDGSGQQKLRIVEFLEKVSGRTWVEIKSTLSRYFTIC